MRHIVGVTVLCVVLVLLALVGGGGVYRMVSAGGGDAYIFNRFTGRVLPVKPKEPESKPDPAAEAIRLVKTESAYEFFTDGRPGESVEDYVRQMGREAKGRVRTLGWAAERQPDGLYVVQFRAQRPGKPVGKGLGWEVDVENRIVRAIGIDPELAKHYGFAD